MELASPLARHVTCGLPWELLKMLLSTWSVKACRFFQFLYILECLIDYCISRVSNYINWTLVWRGKVSFFWNSWWHITTRAIETISAALWKWIDLCTWCRGLSFSFHISVCWLTQRQNKLKQHPMDTQHHARCKNLERVVGLIQHSKQ